MASIRLRAAGLGHRSELCFQVLYPCSFCLAELFCFSCIPPTKCKRESVIEKPVLLMYLTGISQVSQTWQHWIWIVSCSFHASSTTEAISSPGQLSLTQFFQESEGISHMDILGLHMEVYELVTWGRLWRLWRAVFRLGTTTSHLCSITLKSTTMLSDRVGNTLCLALLRMCILKPQTSTASAPGCIVSSVWCLWLLLCHGFPNSSSRYPSLCLCVPSSALTSFSRTPLHQDICPPFHSTVTPGDLVPSTRWSVSLG